MDVTNKSWSEILLELANNGYLGALIAIAIVAFVAGVVLTWLYYSKFANVQMLNKLASLEAELCTAKEERDKYKNAHAQLRKQTKQVRDVELQKLTAERDQYKDLYTKLKTKMISVTDDLYVKLATEDEKPDDLLKTIC